MRGRMGLGRWAGHLLPTQIRARPRTDGEAEAERPLRRWGRWRSRSDRQPYWKTTATPQGAVNDLLNQFRKKDKKKD